MAATRDSHHDRDASSPIRRLLAILAEERGDVGRIFAYAALAGLLGLSLPLGVQAIIGLVAGGLILQPVVVLIGLVVLGTFAAGALQVVQLGVVERLQQRVFARYSLDLAHRLPRADIEALAGADLPEQTNRFFEIVTIQKSLVKLLTEAVSALFAIAAGLVLLTFYHPYLSLFGGVLLGMLGVALWLTGRSGLRTSLAESAAKYRVAHWLQELARHAVSFRLAGASSLPVARMDRELDDYLTHRQAHFRVLARQSMTVVAVKTLVTGGLLVIGAALVVDRRISLGQFVASELVIVTVLAGVEKLILSLSTVYDALTAAEKAAHLRELPITVDRPSGEGRSTMALPHASDARGMALEASALAYRSPGNREDTLQGVTLHVRAGERVALVGSEGAGTSTLLRVLAGLLPSFRGSLAVDGVSMRDVDQAALRDAVALVGPAPMLIEGTIEDNVSLGRPGVTSSSVAAALELAGLRDHVRALPDGLRAAVGSGDARVPSNIVRKIVLARALAARPRLLLFDDFFHHLEPTYKRRLIERLLDRRAGLTIVAASHDPVFLAACDRVLLLDGGRIVAEGTYDGLRGELAERGLLRAQPEPGAIDAPTTHDVALATVGSGT